jgi:hypothetical protein
MSPQGLAASYGLLCLCFRNTTITDYAVLVQSFGLFQCHPLLAAYFSGQEAAKLSVYTPMFFLRHIVRELSDTHFSLEELIYILESNVQEI